MVWSSEKNGDVVIKIRPFYTITKLRGGVNLERGAGVLLGIAQRFLPNVFKTASPLNFKQ